MDVKTINHLLAEGNIDRDDMWPRIIEMESKAHQFRFEFGLNELPTEPGLIIIRGPRQYGKSTWLDMNLRQSAEEFGKGSSYYLNGDEIAAADELDLELTNLYASYSRDAGIKRLFIDEITAVPSWEKAVKRVIDRGLFRDVLIITTGSKASDLRHGSERLPGRKGKLSKNEYIFLPISYREFKLNAREIHGEKSWIAYLQTVTVPMQPGQHIAQYVDQPGLFPGLDNFSGSISVSGPFGVGVLTLRQDKQAFGGISTDGGPILGPFVVNGTAIKAQEPSNTPATAQPISGSAIITGTISTVGDLNSFKITGKAGDVISVICDTQGTGSSLDSYLEVYDSNIKVIARNDQNGLAPQLYPITDSFIQMVLPADGIYYIVVTDAFSNGGSNYTYTLHIKLPPHVS